MRVHRMLTLYARFMDLKIRRNLQGHIEEGQKCFAVTALTSPSDGMWSYTQTENNSIIPALIIERFLRELRLNFLHPKVNVLCRVKKMKKSEKISFLGRWLRSQYRRPQTEAVNDRYPPCWQLWANDPDNGPRNERKAVLNELQACWRKEKKILRISNARLKGLSCLSVLPPDIKALNLAGCDLDYLPPLPEGLRVLNVSHNRLRRLPDLPDSLKIINISNNNIENISYFPAQLEILVMDNNRLRSVPQLPSGLKEFSADNNQLSEIPAPLPLSLSILSCRENRLRSFPETHDSEICWRHIDITDNPVQIQSQSLLRHHTVKQFQDTADVLFPTQKGMVTVTVTYPLETSRGENDHVQEAYMP